MTITKIAAPNWLERNYAVLTLGAWGSPSTLDNVKDPDLGLPALSTDATAASSQMAVDLSTLTTLYGTAPGADCLFIPTHNLTAAATIRVKAGTAAFTSGGSGGGSVLYDSTAITALPAAVYPSAYNGLWGRSAATGPDPIVDAAYNRGVLVKFGATYRANYWWIGISDTSNPDGYVRVSRVLLAPFYQPSKNFDYGVTIEPVGDRVAQSTMTNSQLIDSRRRLARLVSFQVSDIDIDEATAYFLRLALFLGYATQFLFVFDPDDTVHMQLRTFLCTQMKAGAFAYSHYGTNDVPFQALEVI